MSATMAEREIDPLWHYLRNGAGEGNGTWIIALVKVLAMQPKSPMRVGSAHAALRASPPTLEAGSDAAQGAVSTNHRTLLVALKRVIYASRLGRDPRRPVNARDEVIE
jgi:hypothetical protein